MKKVFELFQRIAFILKRFFPLLRYFGFLVAVNSLIFPFNRFFGSLRCYIAVHKHKAILNYLFSKYNDILFKHSNTISEFESKIQTDSIIWTCWWDGENNMPPLVKSCYNSIKKYSNTHPIELITKYNYFKFISIPQYIIDKVNNGIITITHFSNIIRANLLYEYGGIWMDITIMVLNEIKIKDLFFFTLKAPAKNSVSVTLTRFAGLSDYSKHFHNRQTKEISRWSGFLLAGSKHSVIFEYLRDILYAYWKDHDFQIDYLLFDYTIALGYDNIVMMKNEIDKVNCSDMEKFELEINLNNEYNNKDFEKYLLSTFHKLTWKKKFKITTKENKKTIYGYLLNSY